MNQWPEHIPAVTWHGRRGAISNSFAYGVDYMLIDPASREGPALFSRNRWNLFCIRDRDHGGQPGRGRGAQWAAEVFGAYGLGPRQGRRILLLAQPAAYGYSFNPVSFWLLMQDDALLAVIAEVNNTFGDRHSYFCAHSDRREILATDRISARKIFHVSPFQQIGGDYSFWFMVTPAQISIRISLTDGAEGVVATLIGPRKPATSRGLVFAAIRRPLGAMRVLALIHWQAVKLWRKKAAYLPRPVPPQDEVS
jgi:uncharacterized protein